MDPEIDAFCRPYSTSLRHYDAEPDCSGKASSTNIYHDLHVPSLDTMCKADSCVAVSLIQSGLLIVDC